MAQIARELNTFILTTRINAFTNCSADTYCVKLATSAQAIEKSGLAPSQYQAFERYRLVIQPGVRANLSEFE